MKKARQPLKVTAEHVLDWFRQSPQAAELEREAREAEVRHNRRAKAFDEWQEAEDRKAELPALRDALAAAELAYRKAVTTAGLKVDEARGALNRLSQEIDRVQRRSAIELRSTFPHEREALEAYHALIAAKRHLHSHQTSEIARLREELRDQRESGVGFRPGLERMIREHDEAAALLPAVEDGLKRLQEVELDLAPDLAAIVREVTEALPSECSCGSTLLKREDVLAIVAESAQ